MSIEKFQPSYDIYPERIERLKVVSPEAFADGKINWDILKESLGSFVENEDAETEHYAFTWPGKREARRMAGKPPQGTLVPVPGEGVNEDSTENIFIEGDNLEVLKLLQKSYASKINVIYIDPPYNTGNDFIYNDDFAQPLDEYLKLTGQIDTTGNSLVSNKKADGRFHSKWMSMMFPRLMLGMSLLDEDGLMFISIDENEVCNLRKICDELFGSENNLGTLTWIRRTKPINSGDAKYQLQQKVEYVCVYCKGKNRANTYAFNLPMAEERQYNNDGKYGKCRLKDIEDSDSGSKKRDTMKFPILGIKPGDGKRWKIGDEEYRRLLELDRFRVIDGKIKVEIYPQDEDAYKYKPFWSHFDLETVGTAEEGKAELNDLFKAKLGFDTVKPVSLLKTILEFLPKDITILDFFSGTSTSADSILQKNIEDNGATRKFILVQIPEPCEEGSDALRAGYKTISEIGKERIRRVLKKIEEESEPGKVAGKDLGFKVYALQKSHFREWQDYKGNDVKELMDLFSKQEDALTPGWKAENLLVEVMLQEGFPLHSKVESIEAIKANKVVQVKSEFCKHVVFICLDEKVDKKTIEELPLTDKDIFVCLDKALTDEQKVALSDKGVIKTI